MEEEIKIIPLGAGQDVGRSCILVKVKGKTIMLDCGMHMGYNDNRKFPDFTHLAPSGPYTEYVDVVLVSHFHLDHCGALPYFTEICGYDGLIVMSQPTKAICPLLLEDFRKISVERKGEKNFFTSEGIRKCMSKVRTIGLHETLTLESGFEIKAYYAGHVLGAVMFHIKIDGYSIVYTGDYNMTPDRHLGSAWIDRCQPDILITESTYATTIRDSKRCRERDFLRRVHETVLRGGKVLIPVFALGRAQELCILLDGYWKRNNLGHIPIYFSAGLTEKATNYYKYFVTWTNEKVKQTFTERNMFDFAYIKPFQRDFAEQPGPQVLFATPGMLHSGTSLEIFKKWAGDARNLVLLPGFCVVGTVGNRLLTSGEGEREVEIDRQTTLRVKCRAEYLSFSAHADAKGIMQLIQWCSPKHVVLVHGEKRKMQKLKAQIRSSCRIPCYDPGNGMCITLRVIKPMQVDIDRSLFPSNANVMQGRCLETLERSKKEGIEWEDIPVQVGVGAHLEVSGLLEEQNDGTLKLINPVDRALDMGLTAPMEVDPPA